MVHYSVAQPRKSNEPDDKSEEKLIGKLVKWSGSGFQNGSHCNKVGSIILGMCKVPQIEYRTKSMVHVSQIPFVP